MAGQLRFDMPIRGEGAYITPDSLAPSLAKLIRASELLTTTTVLCRMQLDRHRPLNRFPVFLLRFM